MFVTLSDLIGLLTLLVNVVTGLILALSYFKNNKK